MELQAMVSTAMLAINELNKKYDSINETIKTMGSGYDIKTIISNSLESVSELTKKYEVLLSQLNQCNTDIQAIKCTNGNLNSVISKSVVSIQELHKKHCDIKEQVLSIKIPDINFDVTTLVSSLSNELQQVNNKYDDLTMQIQLLNNETTKPRPLEPHVATLITKSVGSIKDLVKKYDELTYKINHINNVTPQDTVMKMNNNMVDIDILASIDARLKKIEELLNIN
jgi:predicted nuclease with TOPRIM domain